jgi:hypothetical protein
MHSDQLGEDESVVDGAIVHPKSLLLLSVLELNLVFLPLVLSPAVLLHMLIP